LFNDVYALHAAICRKMKTDSRVAAILAARNWHDEFWDVYLVLLIGLPYAHNFEIQASPELSGLSTNLDFSALPPVGQFLHEADMALIQANLPRIAALMSAEQP
jgi:hypothetical protein